MKVNKRGLFIEYEIMKKQIATDEIICRNKMILNFLMKTSPLKAE